MDLSSYLVSVSMGMSQAANSQNYQVAVAKKAMDVQEMEGAALCEMLRQPMPSSHRLDVRV